MVACSSTAAACARWPVARSAWPYSIAASASLGLARYRSPYTSTARRGSSGTACAFDDDGEEEVSDPVMSDMVWQPPRPAARTAVTAAEERNRARDPARDSAWLDCRRMALQLTGKADE